MSNYLMEVSISDIIYELPKHNLKAFIDVAKEVDETKYGSITVTFRIHNGFITDVVYQSFRRTRFEIPKNT